MQGYLSIDNIVSVCACYGVPMQQCRTLATCSRVQQVLVSLGNVRDVQYEHLEAFCSGAVLSHDISHDVSIRG